MDYMHAALTYAHRSDTALAEGKLDEAIRLNGLTSWALNRVNEDDAAQVMKLKRIAKDQAELLKADKLARSAAAADNVAKWAARSKGAYDAHESVKPDRASVALHAGVDNFLAALLKYKYDAVDLSHEESEKISTFKGRIFHRIVRIADPFSSKNASFITFFDAGVGEFGPAGHSTTNYYAGKFSRKKWKLNRLHNGDIPFGDLTKVITRDWMVSYGPIDESRLNESEGTIEFLVYDGEGQYATQNLPRNVDGVVSATIAGTDGSGEFVQVSYYGRDRADLIDELENDYGMQLIESLTEANLNESHLPVGYTFRGEGGKTHTVHKVLMGDRYVLTSTDSTDTMVKTGAELEKMCPGSGIAESVKPEARRRPLSEGLIGRTSGTSTVDETYGEHTGSIALSLMK